MEEVFLLRQLLGFPPCCKEVRGLEFRGKEMFRSVSWRTGESYIKLPQPHFRSKLGVRTVWRADYYLCLVFSTQEE